MLSHRFFQLYKRKRAIPTSNYLETILNIVTVVVAAAAAGIIVNNLFAFVFLIFSAKLLFINDVLKTDARLEL